MNSNYLYEYTNLFERVLSTAYQYKYHLAALERNISYSSFFQSLERNNIVAPYIDELSLLKQVFPDLDINAVDGDMLPPLIEVEASCSMTLTDQA